MPFESVPPALDAQFRRAERHAPEYVGLTPPAARELAAVNGVAQVRVLSLDDETFRMYQDHRSGRLNLLVLHGEIVRAAFF